MTRVSIVIPCHNDGAFIGDAVRSALAQTERAEVIVVDDGSDDPETLRVLRALPDRGIRVLTQQNAGLPAARNAAIAAAGGPYILPLDADDLLGERFVQDGASVLDVRPDVGLVGSATRFFGTEAGIVTPNVPHPSEWLIANRLPATAMFRKADWESCGGYAEDLRWAEDWHFWVRLVAMDRDVEVLPFVGLHYRRRAGQMTSHVPWDRQAITRARVIRDGLPIIERYPDEVSRALGSQLNLLQEMRSSRYARARSRLVAVARAARGRYL